VSCPLLFLCNDNEMGGLTIGPARPFALTIWSYYTSLLKCIEMYHLINNFNKKFHKSRVSAVIITRSRTTKKNHCKTKSEFSGFEQGQKNTSYWFKALAASVTATSLKCNLTITMCRDFKTCSVVLTK
jgi:hypothetical protein